MDSKKTKKTSIIPYKKFSTTIPPVNPNLLQQPQPQQLPPKLIKIKTLPQNPPSSTI